jgi:DNA-binding Lrp family transcriptional regulator
MRALFNKLDHIFPTFQPGFARESMAAVVALVSMFVESSRLNEVLEALSKLDNIDEYSEVTGDFDILSVVTCTDMEEFRDVLKNKIQKIPGVKSTVSSIVLGTHKGSKIVDGPVVPSPSS